MSPVQSAERSRTIEHKDIKEKKELQNELLKASREMKSFINEKIVPICTRNGINLHQFYVLSELSMDPGQTITQLSGNTGILKTNFSQVCRKMEDEGLIVRQQMELDKRSSILLLTNHGKQVYEKVGSEIENWYKTKLANQYSEAAEEIETILKGFQALRSFTRRLSC